MIPDEQKRDTAQTLEKAARAQRILYVMMFVFIVLPFIVIWLTGAIRF
jgi:hypothetical protein